MKIVYVILHYMAGKDTIECAESILETTKDSKHKTTVVIVDNGSTNDSFKEINQVFADNEQIVVLHSDKNMGFAKGNNLGFIYAKQELMADFIVMLNNDTIVSQKDFNEIVVKKYQEEKYSVLGPDIITADGYHQNPGSKQGWELKELVVYRLKKRIRILLSYLHVDEGVTKLVESVKEIYRSQTLQGDVKNTILHGACWIFSPMYIERFDGICGETFLYMEEDILKLYADYYGFLMMYSSELSIYHKEDIATNMIEGTADEKMRRKYRRLIESSLVYSKLKKEMLKRQKAKKK